MLESCLLPSIKELQTSAHTWRIEEPSIFQYLDLARSLLCVDDENRILVNPIIHRGIMLGILSKWLTAGDLETVSEAEASEVLNAVFRMIFQPVIDTDDSNDSNKETPNPFDLNLLYELDTVCRHYSQLPADIIHKITLRQLHYLYYLAYNREASDYESKIALAGGKLKKPLQRLKLLNGDTTQQNTASMSPKEKAAYFSKLRRKEGRQPGRLA